MTDWNALGWAGWSLGNNDTDGDQIKILGEDAGILGFGATAPVGERTQRLAGGSQLGRSVASERTIIVPKMQTSSRAKARAFAATMAATDDLTVLEMAGLLFADDNDRDNPAAGQRVCVYANPQGVTVPVDVLTMGLDVVHLYDATWVAPDPTIYTVAATTVNGTPANDTHSLAFTNVGNVRSNGGRAWTIQITASTIIKSPFIQLGTQRVEWTGLRIMPGQSLYVGSDRHSFVGSLAVDGYARSGTNRFLNWPTMPPGLNTFTAGCLTGTCTAQLVARSTW